MVPKVQQYNPKVKVPSWACTPATSQPVTTKCHDISSTMYSKHCTSMETDDRTHLRSVASEWNPSRVLQLSCAGSGHRPPANVKQPLEKLLLTYEYIATQTDFKRRRPCLAKNLANGGDAQLRCCLAVSAIKQIPSTCLPSQCPPCTRRPEGCPTPTVINQF